MRNALSTTWMSGVEQKSCFIGSCTHVVERRYAMYGGHFSLDHHREPPRLQRQRHIEQYIYPPFLKLLEQH